MKPERVLEIAKKTCHGWEKNEYGEHFNFPTNRSLLDFASALEAALLEGKVLVPVEPTEEMLQEAWQTLPHIPLSKYNIKILWACMIQAAPKGGE